MAEISFVGGPFDGLRLKSGLGVPFLWTDGKRCYRAPARGRELYRGMGEPMHGSVLSRYRFVGNTHVLCACGGFRKKDASCQMCGATS